MHVACCETLQSVADDTTLQKKAQTMHRFLCIYYIYSLGLKPFTQTVVSALPAYNFHTEPSKSASGDVFNFARQNVA